MCQQEVFQWDYQLFNNPPYFPFANEQGHMVTRTYGNGSCQTDSRLFAYNTAGQVTAMGQWSPSLNSPSSYPSFTVGYTYDNEGLVTAVKYPDMPGNTGPTYNYTYDSLGRLSGMTDSASNTLVNGVTRGPAGELLTMNWLGNNENRQYNSLGQMTRLTSSGASWAIDFEYRFTAGANNGKISAVKDWVTGEEVDYAYDALNRLASAQTASGAPTTWGQSFAYDGFGNLTDVNTTAGSTPNLHVVADAATNRIVGGSCDANGNDLSQGTYNASNRLVAAAGGVASYGYDGDEHRMSKLPQFNATSGAPTNSSMFVR